MSSPTPAEECWRSQNIRTARKQVNLGNLPPVHWAHNLPEVQSMGISIVPCGSEPAFRFSQNLRIPHTADLHNKMKQW